MYKSIWTNSQIFLQKLLYFTLYKTQEKFRWKGRNLFSRGSSFMSSDRNIKCKVQTDWFISSFGHSMLSCLPVFFFPGADTFCFAPVCFKTQETPAKCFFHLHRVCMKTSTEAEITEVVQKAKKDVLDCNEGSLHYFGHLRSQRTQR